MTYALATRQARTAASSIHETGARAGCCAAAQKMLESWRGEQADVRWPHV